LAFFSCFAKRFSFSEDFGSFLVFALLFCSLFAISDSFESVDLKQSSGNRLLEPVSKNPCESNSQGFFEDFLLFKGSSECSQSARDSTPGKP
jgi:hypothetical protein